MKHSVHRSRFAIAAGLALLACSPAPGEQTPAPGSSAPDEGSTGPATPAPPGEPTSPTSSDAPSETPVTPPPTTTAGPVEPTSETPPVNPPVNPPGNSTPPTIPPPDPDPPSQPEGSDIPPGSGPLGVETTCDGKDDDSNGVIDDVEVTADNVCDCLRIATLGLHGEWGTGDVTTGWLGERLEFPVESLDGETLTAERLAPYQIVLVRDVSTNHSPDLSFSEAEVTALWNWVRDGGGLMTVIGYSDAGEASNVNRLLEPFGLSYGGDQIVQGQGAAVPVTEWFEHTLTGGITQVGADNGYPAVGQGFTIAAQDGFDVGKATSIGDGHVLVWGDEWVTYEGEWRDNATYQVERFWKNALRWLTRVNECQVPAPQ